jgi:HEPN domain-containing protein
LTLRAIPFARTHDIENLIHQLPTEVQLPLSVEEQRLLTDYATVSRYPGEWEPVDFTDAKLAVTLAQTVREIIRPYLA